MNTFQLNCFMTVAKTLNFARAAEQLNITQPAVTHQIRSLEEELNVKLFKRTTRMVELTPSGYLFINDARDILETAIRAKKRFENPGEQDIVELRIGCQSHTYLRGMPMALERLRKLHPALHPRFQAEPVPVLRRLLQDGDLDVLMDFQEEEGQKRGVIYRELLKIPMVCLCAADHPLAGKEKICPEDLEEEKLIFSSPMRSPSAVVRFQGALMGKHSMSDVCFSDSPETAVLLTRAGYGISFLPDLFLPQNPFLAKVPLDQAEEMSFGVYFRAGETDSILRDFVRIMADVCEISDVNQLQSVC